MLLHLKVNTQEELDSIVNIFGINKVIESLDRFNFLFEKYFEDIYRYAKELPSKGDNTILFIKAIVNSECKFPTGFIEFLLNKFNSSRFFRDIGEYITTNNIEVTVNIKNSFIQYSPFTFSRKTSEYIYNYSFCHLFEDDPKIPFLIGEKDFFSEESKTQILNLCSTFGLVDIDDSEIYFLSKEYYDDIKIKVREILKNDNEYLKKILEGYNEFFYRGVSIKKILYEYGNLYIEFKHGNNKMNGRYYQISHYSLINRDFPRDIDEYFRNVEKGIDDWLDE